MSRFRGRLPGDVPIDHPYTRRVLLAFLGVAASFAVFVVPKVRAIRAVRAEWDRCRSLVAELIARRPSDVAPGVWDDRCGWIQTACANVFVPSGDPTVAV